MNQRLSLELLRRGLPVHADTVLVQPGDVHPPAVGPGAALLSDGSVVASVSGLAMIGPESVWVYPAQIYRGDVYHGKPLVAPGNLIVLGSVAAAARISASGSVGIRGEVSSARVEAMGSIALLTGCNHSRIHAGANKRIYDLSLERLDGLDAAIRQLLAVLIQLNAHPSFRTMDLQSNLAPLLNVLVERSFSAFPGQVGEVLKRCQRHGHLGGPIQGLGSLLIANLSGDKFLGVSKEQLEEIQCETRHAITQLAAARASREELLIQYNATGSTLRSSGRIAIETGDCHGCQLHSGSTVQVDGEIIGGSVEAAQSIKAPAATGGGTLELNSPGQILIDNIDSGTLLRICHLSIRLTAPVAPADVTLVAGRLSFASQQEVTTNV